MATAGSYRIWTADEHGNLLDGPDDEEDTKKFPNPGDPAAVDIYFGLETGAPRPPPKDQIDLQGDIEKVLGAARRLYLEKLPKREGKFRRYFVRLFRIAQLGLEGEDASPDVARGALVTVTADLVDDEAGQVKNGHLAVLGRSAALFSIPFALAYFALTLGNPQFLDPILIKFGVVRTIAANFMLLWIGCFLGVWLSYGIRTSTFTLADLTSIDSDRLLPHLRLTFAGTLTMILGLLFILEVVEIKVGGYLVTEIATQPARADRALERGPERVPSFDT